MERDDLWVAVVDYGVGNLRNVYKALEAAGTPARIVTEPGEWRGGGDCVAGVGAFGDAAANLRRAGFQRPLLDAIAEGVPLLGICVGMQLLFDESEEMGRHAGLGVIPGRVVRFVSDLPPTPLPAKEGEPASPLLVGGGQGGEAQGATDRLEPAPSHGHRSFLAGVPEGAYRFVHSYYCAPDDPVYTLASTHFGIRYASIVRRGSVWGIQCHPEKSQAVGLRILGNFVEIAGETETGDGETRRQGDGAKT